MCRSAQNSIVRNKKHDFQALVIDADAEYDTDIEKAASILEINPGMCSLVHMSGSRIAERNIVETGRSCPWSIVKTAFSRTSAVKIGVFCEDEDSEVSLCFTIECM